MHLMNPHLMFFSSIRKAGVEDEEVLAGLFIIISRVVSWRYISCPLTRTRVADLSLEQVVPE
ncbi:hypothetical protein D3C76_1876560 [compost metagenome]